MDSSFWIPVSFGQPEINNVNYTSLISFSNHKIISFNVSVNETLSVNGLKSIYYLQAYLKDGTQTEFFFMRLKEVIK